MAEQAFATPFSSLPTRIDLPATDHKIIDWWKQNRIFERTLERTKDGASWVFYEARRLPTAPPARTTSRPGSSRTCSRATAR